MNYVKKSFTVTAPGTQSYADNWEQTFRRTPTSPNCTKCGVELDLEGVEQDLEGLCIDCIPGPDDVPVVCLACHDSHQMVLNNRDVPCTYCPTPCQGCRKGGVGPYCAVTPCSCKCHLRVDMETL